MQVHINHHTNKVIKEFVCLAIPTSSVYNSMFKYSYSPQIPDFEKAKKNASAF
jgi:hypothetical protein